MGNMDGFLLVVTTLARSQGLARSPSIGRPPELFPAELTPDPWVTVLTQGRLRNELEKLSHGFESYPWGVQVFNLGCLFLRFFDFSSLE